MSAFLFHRFFIQNRLQAGQARGRGVAAGRGLLGRRLLGFRRAADKLCHRLWIQNRLHSGESSREAVGGGASFPSITWLAC